MMLLFSDMLYMLVRYASPSGMFLWYIFCICCSNIVECP